MQTKEIDELLRRENYERNLSIVLFLQSFEIFMN